MVTVMLLALVNNEKKYTRCAGNFDDHDGRRGKKVQIIARWRHSGAPPEALVVLYRVMCAESQRRIRMAIAIAGEPRVLFFIVN